MLHDCGTLGCSTGERPGYTVGVSAPTNAEAREIGAAIRQKRQEAGEVGPTLRTIRATDNDGARYDMTLAKGDRVRLFRNTNARFADGTHGSIGRNASVLTVEDVGKAGITLRTDKDRVGFVRWETLAREGGAELAPGEVRTPDMRPKLSSGNAMTLSAVQGRTDDDHIAVSLNGSRQIDAHGALVGASRNRDQAYRVFSEAAERQAIFRASAKGRFPQITPNDVFRNIAANLSRRSEKSSALSLMDRLHDKRHESVDHLQRTAQPDEQRRADGREAVHMRQRFAFGLVRERVVEVAREAWDVARATIVETVGLAMQHVREAARQRATAQMETERPRQQQARRASMGLGL